MSLYEKISGYYDELFPLKKTRVSLITSFLEKEGMLILDVGCASGEQALALAKKGHRVFGIDLDRDMVDAAREKAKSLDLRSKVEFLEKDMANVGIDFLPAFFDAVICFGNTLVHLENPGKIEEFFKGVLKILKNRGIFILQVVNFDRVLAEKIMELPEIESENFTFHREYFYNRIAHRIRFQAGVTEEKSGITKKYSELLYPLISTELRTTLENAAFSKIQFFGNESKAPYGKQSPALIAVARNIEEEK